MERMTIDRIAEFDGRDVVLGEIMCLTTISGNSVPRRLTFAKQASTRNTPPNMMRAQRQGAAASNRIIAPKPSASDIP